MYILIEKTLLKSKVININPMLVDANDFTFAKDLIRNFLSSNVQDYLYTVDKDDERVISYTIQTGYKIKVVGTLENVLPTILSEKLLQNNNELCLDCGHSMHIKQVSGCRDHPVMY